jgi:adenosylhomocysteine nucleosidase
MIAILGENEDDVLYFKAKLSHPEIVTLMGNIQVLRGFLSEHEALIAVTGQSNYRSELLTALLLEKFEPYLVINVGCAISLSEQLHQGDIFIADRYYASDVDFSALFHETFGQIPGFGRYFVADSALNEEAEKTSYLVSDRYIQRGYLLSGNTFYEGESDLTHLLVSHYLQEGGLLAYDTSSLGVALACAVNKTALLTLKAISMRLGKADERLTYLRKGLEAEPSLGQIIATLLVEKEK